MQKGNDGRAVLVLGPEDWIFASSGGDHGGLQRRYYLLPPNGGDGDWEAGQRPHKPQGTRCIMAVHSVTNARLPRLSLCLRRSWAPLSPGIVCSYGGILGVNIRLPVLMYLSPRPRTCTTHPRLLKSGRWSVRPPVVLLMLSKLRRLGTLAWLATGRLP